MNWKKLVNRKNVFLAVMGFFVLSTLTSCHRDGCPGMITKAPVEKVADKGC
jgi:hypothetical protein